VSPEHTDLHHADSLQGLHDLVTRRAPGLADRLELEQVSDADNPLEQISVEASDGRVRVVASSVSAAGVGIARALEAIADADLSFDFLDRIDVPETIPDLPEHRYSTALRMRYHLNPVAVGYTMASWDWPQWEQHLDWMALHGMNAPLLLVGHDAVLVAMLQDLGMERADAARYVGGPAFLPWTTMGITHDLGAALSDDALAHRAELGRRIATRARGLGMRVVLPGFGGQLPAELVGTARTIDWQGWKTSLAAPGSAMFAEAAASLHHHQRKLFGTDHLYAVDPYIESLPPSTSEAELAEHAEAIYSGMHAADEDAVWILQGWPFHYRKEFWTPQRVRALLSRVPEENLVLLDLWGEHAPMWQSSDFMYGRRWLWCLTHSFGGRFGLFGDLTALADDLSGHRAGAAAGSRGRLEGFGITAESLDENALVYELAARALWDPMPSAAEWTQEHLARRWESLSPQALEASSLLLKTLYGPGRTRSTPSPLIARPWSKGLPFAAQRLAGEALPTTNKPPSANLDAENDTSMLAALPSLMNAARDLLELAEAPEAPEALRHDVSQLALHVGAQSARAPMRAMVAAAQASEPIAVRSELAALTSLLQAADAVAATRPELLIGRWIADARLLAGENAELADALERDARSLISVWGEQDSGLHDYSARHWSGPLADLHLPRWQAWGEWLAAGAEGSIDLDDPSPLRTRIQQIEEDWRGAITPYPVRPRDGFGHAVRTLLDLAADQLPRLVPSEGGP